MTTTTPLPSPDERTALIITSLHILIYLKMDNNFSWFILQQNIEMVTKCLYLKCGSWFHGKALNRGTQRKFLRKTPKNNNKAWRQFSEAILSSLGDCWEQFICSSLPARPTEESVPASKVHLQSGCNLTYWKVSQQTYVQTLLASLGVVIGQNSALQWRREGNRVVTNST